MLRKFWLLFAQACTVCVAALFIVTGVVGGGKGVIRPGLITFIPVVAIFQSDAVLPSELPMRW